MVAAPSILNAENMRVLRAGAGYEIFRDRVKRLFSPLLKEAGVTLDEDVEHGMTVVAEAPGIGKTKGPATGN